MLPRTKCDGPAIAKLRDTTWLVTGESARRTRPGNLKQEVPFDECDPDRKGLQESLRKADLSASPSHTEGFPMVFL